MKPTLTDAKKKANKKWDDANKEKKRVYRYRSYARKFIRDLSSLDDLDELTELISERREQLKP